MPTPLPVGQLFDWRLLAPLAVLSAAGTLAVLPYVLTTQAAKLAKMTLPMPLQRLIVLQTVQGVVLFTLVTGIGLWLAGRIGLGAPILSAWLNGQPAGIGLRSWRFQR